LSGASSLRSVSTGAENIYVERSPSHLSTTSSTYGGLDDGTNSGQHDDPTIYSLASDVEELSLENKNALTAPATSYPVLNGHFHNNNVENNEIHNQKVKHSIGNYVRQSMVSWDEVG